MDTEKLDLFCGIYRDDAILDKFSLIDIMIDLQVNAELIRSDIFHPFSVNSANDENNNEIIYDAVNNLKYDRGADIEYLSKWLNEFEISIDDIVNNNLGSNEIGKYISVKHIDFKGTEENIRRAHLIQVEFLDYFLKFYADNILSRSSSPDDINKNVWKRIKLERIDVECLNDFCETIFSERLLINSSFTLDNKLIKKLSNQLEIEISENIICFNDNRVESYLDRVIIALEEIQNNINFSTDSMENWISKFDINLNEFPDFKNKELNLILDKIYSGEHISVESRKEVFQIQTDLYFYACNSEVEKMIGFLESKKKISINVKNMIKKENKVDVIKQLTVNQSVILLDKLGLFVSPVFEEMPNTKKALLLRDLLGKNDKNIKTAIENLELKPNDIKQGYKNDIDMIQHLLDSY